MIFANRYLLRGIFAKWRGLKAMALQHFLFQALSFNKTLSYCTSSCSSAHSDLSWCKASKISSTVSPLNNLSISSWWEANEKGLSLSIWHCKTQVKVTFKIVDLRHLKSWKYYFYTIIITIASTYEVRYFYTVYVNKLSSTLMIHTVQHQKILAH